RAARPVGVAGPVRGEGVEPPSAGSEPAGLPLADPRITFYPLDTPLRLRFTSVSSARIPVTGRAADRDSRPHFFSESGRRDLNPRSPAPHAGGLPTFLRPEFGARASPRSLWDHLRDLHP